jgi:putative Mn2+ efflux pump MntP
MTNKKKSFLKGGENDILNSTIDNSFINQAQKFIAIIIIGYFGIKVIYGSFFGFYPKKYYYRDIEINTNESSEEQNSLTKNIALNAYVPGLWNNEMSDIVSVLVMAFIIFIMTIN